MGPLGFKLILFGFMCLRVEGSCSLENCSDPRTCVLSADRRTCRCAAGLYGPNCEHGAQVKVLCGRDFMSIRAAEDFFSYLKVPLESLHLPNRSCRAQREVIAGTPFFMFRTSREKYLACGGKPLQKNSTHLLYSLTVQSEPQVSGNIIRDPAIKLDFTCVYPNLRRVSLPFPVRPISSQTVMQVEETDATIRMGLFADSSFSRALSGTPTIELQDPCCSQDHPTGDRVKTGSRPGQDRRPAPHDSINVKYDQIDLKDSKHPDMKHLELKSIIIDSNSSFCFASISATIRSSPAIPETITPWAAPHVRNQH